MTIQVTGTLTNPLGLSIQIGIRVTAINSEVAVQGTQGILTTQVDGTYNFNLVEGMHSIEIRNAGEYEKKINIIVTSQTPSVIDLPTLLADHTVII